MPDVPSIAIKFKLLIVRLAAILVIDVGQGGLIVDRPTFHHVLLAEMLDLHFGEGVVAHNEGKSAIARELHQSDLIR